MGKPIVKEYAPNKTILKYFPYQGAACVVTESTGTPVTVGNSKIIKAGTPYPANDATCKGYLLEDVDVTMGDAPGTYVFDGSIDNVKLTENGITVSDEAKAATPRVTFFD